MSIKCSQYLCQFIYFFSLQEKNSTCSQIRDDNWSTHLLLEVASSGYFVHIIFNCYLNTSMLNLCIGKSISTVLQRSTGLLSCTAVIHIIELLSYELSIQLSYAVLSVSCLYCKQLIYIPVITYCICTCIQIIVQIVTAYTIYN